MLQPKVLEEVALISGHLTMSGRKEHQGEDEIEINSGMQLTS
mgnify:CR=1 FL=1